jgi:hypothetical protein
LTFFTVSPLPSPFLFIMFTKSGLVFLTRHYCVPRTICAIRSRVWRASLASYYLTTLTLTASDKLH